MCVTISSFLGTFPAPRFYHNQLVVSFWDNGGFVTHPAINFQQTTESQNEPRRGVLLLANGFPFHLIDDLATGIFGGH